jgi:polyhydroxyalkanoate synthesis regulator phasin
VLLADIESQANNLKQELQIKSSDIQRLTERIDYLERDLHQVRKKKMNFKYNS